jgi:glycosyltransferase involved in cell wall biosynthesis
MLAQSYAPVVGGVERMVEDLSLELAERGHEVSVATLGHPAIRRDHDDGAVTVHELGSTSYRLPGMHQDPERRHAPPVPDPETVIDLRRVLRAERPDVVHAHNWIVHSYLPLARRSGAALVLSLHDYGLICPTQRLLHRGVAPCSGPGPWKCVACAGEYYGRSRGAAIAVGMKSMRRPVRRGVDLFVPVSEAVRDLSGLGPADPYRVVPNFIRDLPPPPATADPRLAPLPDEPYIVFLGDATVDKGALHLARAYARLERPPPLVLVGRPFLAELAERPGVHQVGPWPHDLTIEALRRAAFAVVPSVMPETFGLAALEAGAAGKAVVASGIGGLREVVADGETGLLVPPGDEDALRHGLQTLIDDPGLRERMGSAALRRAADYAPGEVVPRFEAAYEDALLARRSPDGGTRGSGPEPASAA